MKNNHKIWLALTILITFIFLSPNIYNDFLNWDDLNYIVHNPLIKDLSINGIFTIFTTKEVIGTYSPLVLLSWAIDYTIGGNSPFIFHLTNLILHILTTCLVYFLSFLITKRIEATLIVSILFGIHPMHVESVGWVSARKDLLYSMFFFSALIAYFYYLNNPLIKRKKVFYITCLFLYLASLLSKGTAIIFPLILFLFDFIHKRKISIKVITEKIPFILLSILFVHIAIRAQQIGGAMDNNSFVSVLDSISVGFYGYFTYLAKSIFPFNLSGYHPYPNKIGTSNPLYFYISALPILALLIYTIIIKKTFPLLVFGIGFFFIALIPVIQVLPFGTAVMADRYTYLPYFGLFLVYGILISKLLDRFSSYKKGIVIICSLYIFSIGIKSYSYSKTFKNSETFWSNVISKYPNAHLPRLNRGSYRITLGKYHKAIIDFNKGILLNPNQYWLFFNRALAYKNLGDTTKAIQNYTSAILVNKNNTSSFLNRGIIYYKTGNYTKALLDFDKVIFLQKNNFKAYYNRAICFEKMRLYDNAISDLSFLISENKMFDISLFKRALIYLKLDDKKNAMNDLNLAIKYNPSFANAYSKRGQLHLQNKSFSLAQKDFIKLIHLNPNQIDAYINLGIILMNGAKFNEAMGYFNNAQKIDNSNYLVHYYKGILHQKLGNYKIAMEELDICLDLNPSYKEANITKMEVIKIIQLSSSQIVFPK